MNTYFCIAGILCLFLFLYALPDLIGALGPLDGPE